MINQPEILTKPWELSHERTAMMIADQLGEFKPPARYSIELVVRALGRNTSHLSPS